METMIALAFVFVASFLQNASTEQQRKERSAEPARQECPDDRGWTGEYANLDYGFSVLIPEGYEGFWNSAGCVNDKKDASCVCMSDHGRIIPLSSKPYELERHIEVYASHAADLDDPSVTRGIARWLKFLEEMSTQHTLFVEERSNIFVDGVKAERVVARYYDKRARKWFEDDMVELLKGGDEFTMYLRTPRGNYQHDKRIFDQFVASLMFMAPD